MKGNAIEIRHLTKTYGKHRGVEDVSLSVEEGDIFGFLGPNGAGKSTTIRSMLGMLRFEQGEIRLLGKNSPGEQKEILRQTGEKGQEREFSYTGSIKELISRLADRELDDLLIQEPTLDELFMHYYEKEES